MAYASKRGAAFVDRALYLPRAWTNDPARRAEASVPEEPVFRNKAELMLDRAIVAGVPARWMVADSFCGRLRSFREWLGERGRPYTMMVPKKAAVPMDRGGETQEVRIAHSDEQVVQRMFTTYGRGDTATLRRVLAGNAIYHGGHRALAHRRDRRREGQGAPRSSRQHSMTPRYLFPASLLHDDANRRARVREHNRASSACLARSAALPSL